MSKMNNLLKDVYCCCQVFPLAYGMFLIAAHSFLQGAIGILVVITSYYQNKDTVINLVTVVASACLFPAGIFVFGTALYDNYQAARFSAIFFSLISMFNFGATVCYLFWYSDFEANSQLDKIFFWRNDHDWVAVGELPLTIWHVLVYSIVFALLLWWYYSFVLWKYAKVMKQKHDLEMRGFDPVHRRLSFWNGRRHRHTV